MTALSIKFYRARRGLDISKETDRLISRAVRTALKIYAPEGKYEISVTYTDDEGIRELNREHRNIDRSTDVLSFPMQDYLDGAPLPDAEIETDPDTGRIYLGDIVLSYEHALAQAQEYGHSAERETAFLSVHSSLHLIGFDHEDTDERRIMMEKAQEQTMSALGISR